MSILDNEGHNPLGFGNTPRPTDELRAALEAAERTIRAWHRAALAMRDLAINGDCKAVEELYFDTATSLPFYGVDPDPLPSQKQASHDGRRRENEMSKLAHSNQETMDEIERNARDAPSPPEPPDPLDQQYCCFDCSAKFRIGEAIAADVLRCPKCRSANMHPIGTEPEQLSEYHGPIGTKN